MGGANQIVPNPPFVTYINIKTSGVLTTPQIVFEANGYQKSATDTTIVNFPSIVTSICVCNTSSQDASINVFFVDGSITPGSTLTQYYICKNLVVPSGKNVDIIQKDIFVGVNDIIMANASSSGDTFDFIISYNELIN